MMLCLHIEYFCGIWKKQDSGICEKRPEKQFNCGSNKRGYALLEECVAAIVPFCDNASVQMRQQRPGP